MSPLDRPLTLRCGATLPNRAALAPLTNTQSHTDGRLSEDEARWLRARAEGGFGLVSACATYVSDEGKAWKGQLGLASDVHRDAVVGLAADLREAGAIGIVQLHHAGARASLAPGDRLSTVDGDGIRGATPDDLARVQDDFVAAAVRAEQAGFDGVEVHGANGYLFTQFLAPEDNPRTDAWGGDIAGRARLLRDTLRAVRAAVSPGFIVGVRISPVDTWDRRGLLLDDSMQLVAWLAEDGADFVHLSLRDAAGPPPFEDTEVPVATVLRQALPAEVALLAAGGIDTRAAAERAFNAGVDVAVVGRAAIPHADWPRASAAADFQPSPAPWRVEELRAAAVSESFIDYLRGFRSPMVAD